MPTVLRFGRVRVMIYTNDHRPAHGHVGEDQRQAAHKELAFLGCVIAELPVKYQEAFRLHRVQDESFEDIAHRMGLKERMVRRYVTNALLYLRLRREGVTAEEAWREVQS